MTYCLSAEHCRIHKNPPTLRVYGRPNVQSRDGLRRFFSSFRLGIIQP
jgi:hypothetical protein